MEPPRSRWLSSGSDSKRSLPTRISKIDSTKTTNNLPTDDAVSAEIIKKFLSDLKIYFTVDSRGQVLAAEVNEEAVKAWGPIIPGGTDRISEKGIMKTLKQMLPVLPESPLAVGDTWTDTLELNKSPGAGLEKVLVTYRYAGPVHYKNRTVDKIVTEAKLDWGNEDFPQGLTVNVVSQENPGVIYFDNVAGHLVKIENTQKKMSEYRHDDQIAEEQVKVTSIIEISPAED